MPIRPRNLSRGLRYGEGYVTPRGNRSGAERFQARWLQEGRWRSRTFASLDEAEDFLRATARARGGAGSDFEVDLSAVMAPSGEIHYRARWLEGVLWQSATFVSLEDAESWIRERSGGDEFAAAGGPLSVPALVEAYLERGSGGDGWSESTQASYWQRYRCHIEPAFGVSAAARLSTPQVQFWIDGLVASGLAASTVESAVTLLNAAYRQAVAIGLVPSNPVTHTRKPKVRAKPVDRWSLPQVRQALEAIEDPMWQALYRLAVTTGLRPGELRALQWRDIDLSSAALVVSRTMTKDRYFRTVVGSRTKTGANRAVALPPSTVAALVEWRAVQRVVSIDGFVFSRRSGEWLPLSTWQKFHASLLAETGLPRITLKGLRHTHVSLESEAGVNPKIVSDRVGHRSVTTTLDRYTQVSLEMQRSSSDALDERISGATSRKPPARSAGEGENPA